MFAGPDGSGKSTLKLYLPSNLLGVYLNPDEIEETIRQQGFLDFAAFSVSPAYAEVLSYFKESSFLSSAGLGDIADEFELSNNRLNFRRTTVNSYHASVIADFLRQKLLEQKISFTFETVMSHRSKLELLSKATHSGYRTYLYFVATEDPAINVSRVHARVKMGGHSVPEDLIVKRYYRSLDLLMEAIHYTNRAYIFDNSQEKENEHTWIAEITEGRELDLKSDKIPAWCQKFVLDKIK